MKIKLELCVEVLAFVPDVATASSAEAALTCATKHRFEKIGEIASFKFKASAPWCKSASATALVLLMLPGLFIRFAMLPVFAVLIVLFSFFWIAQHFVGLVDLLKFFLCIRIVRIQIWMILTRELAVGLFNVGFS